MPSLPTSSSRARQSQSRVDALWGRLTAIYGHRWTSAYGENPAGLGGDTWAAGLFGITPQELATGLEACAFTRADPWPPTLPEFRCLCLSIPTLTAVRLDIAKPERQPFTRMVLAQLDMFSFTRAEQAKAERLLSDAYDHARELRLAGVEPPALQAVLTADPPPPYQPASPDVARRVLRDLGAFLDRGGALPPADPRAGGRLPAQVKDEAT